MPSGKAQSGLGAGATGNCPDVAGRIRFGEFVMRVERKLAFTGLAGVAVMLSSLAVPALSQAAPLTANVANAAGNCGSYQCFYYATDFLNSSPNPQTGQVATVPLAPRVVGPAPGGPSMLVGLDNGPRAFWEVSD